MDNQFEPLAEGEVLSIDEYAQILIGHRTFRVGEFAQAIKAQLEDGVSGQSDVKDAWFSEAGVPCEVLRFSANGWQKGKVRVNLEFCPEDFESQQESTLRRDRPVPIPDPSEGEEEFNLDTSPMGLEDDAFSMSLEEESSPSAFDNLALDAPTDLDAGLESPSVIYVEMELEAPTSFPSDEFEFTQTPTSLDDELEFAQTPTSLDDELEFTQTPTSLDDDFDLGEISESIDQELGLVESPEASGDEVLDFGEMSDFGEISLDEANLDSADMTPGSVEELLFEDAPANNESEANETNALLDDVWQDINQANRQNNPY